MAVKNYYTALGVKQTDSDDVIKNAYRKLAKQYHPDLNPGDKEAEAKFKEIGEAYEILSDPDKRKKHDNELSGGSKQNPFASGPSKPMSTPMGKVDYENLMNNFDNYFSPQNIKSSAQKSGTGANPIDTTSMFERFMGFTGPNKKK